jgi:hypothetical protein
MAVDCHRALKYLETDPMIATAFLFGLVSEILYRFQIISQGSGEFSKEIEEIKRIRGELVKLSKTGQLTKNQILDIIDSILLLDHL